MNGKVQLPICKIPYTWKRKERKERKKKNMETSIYENRTKEKKKET
jgi:hypothetical protein